MVITNKISPWNFEHPVGVNSEHKSAEFYDSMEDLIR